MDNRTKLHDTSNKFYVLETLRSFTTDDYQFENTLFSTASHFREYTKTGSNPSTMNTLTSKYYSCNNDKSEYGCTTVDENNFQAYLGLTADRISLSGNTLSFTSGFSGAPYEPNSTLHRQVYTLNIDSASTLPVLISNTLAPANLTGNNNTTDGIISRDGTTIILNSHATNFGVNPNTNGSLFKKTGVFSDAPAQP